VSCSIPSQKYIRSWKRIRKEMRGQEEDSDMEEIKHFIIVFKCPFHLHC
jgi:hypothetical protein